VSERHATQPRIPLLDALPTLVDTECRRRGISQRTAAAELGLSSSTITRIIQGKGCDAYTLLVLLPWLNLTSDWFSEPDASNAYRRGWNDCATTVTNALTAADSPAS
jgi:hypothetical protein